MSETTGDGMLLRSRECRVRMFHCIENAARARYEARSQRGLCKPEAVRGNQLYALWKSRP